MNMTNMYSEMNIALHYATVEVYNDFMERCIVDSGNEEERYKLLRDILEEVVIPDESFTWLTEYDIEPHLETIELLMDKKIELDEFIRNLLSVCQKEGYENITIKQLNDIMVVLHPEIKMSFKISLFQLLLDGKYYPYLYREDTKFPLKNISRNYRFVDKIIDDAMTKAAYYARSRTFSKMYAIQKSKKLHWKFEPTTNTHHANVLKWLQDNVKRVEENSNARLGWSCGPDSAPWPSTYLHDYNRTLCILNEIKE